MSVGKDVLYLLLEQNTEVAKRDVYLTDVAQLECTNADALNRIKTIKILKIPPVKKFRKVLNVVDIITEVQKLYPDMEVQNLGEADYIVTYVKDDKNHPVLDWIKTIVWKSGKHEAVHQHLARVPRMPRNRSSLQPFPLLRFQPHISQLH